MNDVGYPLHQAVADLSASGLFAGCLKADAGRWLRFEPDAVPHLPGAFQGAEIDSRRIQTGQLFVALKGERSDGRHFIGEALSKGAMALTRPWPAPDEDPLLSDGVPPAGVVLLRVVRSAAPGAISGCSPAPSAAPWSPRRARRPGGRWRRWRRRAGTPAAFAARRSRTAGCTTASANRKGR